MSRFWKSVLSLFCTCCFCSSAKADDLDLASRAYLTDKQYAKHIEVKAYLVTKDQVAKLFSEENGEITPKTNKELYSSKKDIFLLVRCKNKGKYAAFGILNCKLPDRGVPVSIEIDTLPANNSVHDCVIYIDGGVDPNSNIVPVITYEWKSLYTM